MDCLRTIHLYLAKSKSESTVLSTGIGHTLTVIAHIKDKMNKLFTLILAVIASTTFGQINMADSTAQVIAYWDLGEKQSYSVSLQKIKLREADTTSNTIMTFNVDITVIDSTDSSYLIEWLYHNYNTNSTAEISKKATALAENLKVLIETDEYGVIKGVQNWEEISEYMKKAIQPIKDEAKRAPELEPLVAQLENMYSTKHGIEAGIIQDAQQFLAFHGGNYLLGEVLEFPMEIPNMLDPGNPLNTKVTLYLDELNPDDNNFILRSMVEVDSEQLTSSTLKYLKSISKSTGSPTTTKEEIGQLTNVINTDSRIHGSGWVIYSIQTTVVEGTGGTDIEERIIEID